jgi:hypothetical protein
VIFVVLITITLLSCLSNFNSENPTEDFPEHISLADIQVFGPLRQRAEKNFDRLDK